MARQTSIKAFREIRDSGLLSLRRWQVYRTLYRCGPATASEVYFKMGMNKQLQASIQSRLLELKVMDCVEEVGKRACTHTGKTCIVYDINGKIPIPYKRPPTEKDKEIRKLKQRIKELRKKNRQLKKRLMLYE